MSPAVHQFVPTLEPSAVGDHALQVQRLLRDLGMASEIFTDWVADPWAGRGRHFREYGASARAGADDVIVYQTATGSQVAEFVLERPQRLVVNYHNVTPSRFFAPWDDGVVNAVSWGASQLHKMAKRAELGIAVSRFNERELVDAGFARTAVAPVLVDLDHMAREVDAAAEARLRDAKSGGGADLLFVGRIAPNKAQHDLVKALAVYRRTYDPNARLHLVGASSSEAYSDAVKAYVARLGLEDAVNLTGPVPSGVLAAHYRTADAFVCLSEHEGFCVPLLEAMHNHVPIVAFAAAAVPETVAGAAVLLDDKSPAMVAAAVHRVQTDAVLRDQLVAAGGTRLAEFSLPRARERFAEALQTVLT